MCCSSSTGDHLTCKDFITLFDISEKLSFHVNVWTRAYIKRRQTEHESDSSYLLWSSSNLENRADNIRHQAHSFVSVFQQYRRCCTNTRISFGIPPLESDFGSAEARRRRWKKGALSANSFPTVSHEKLKMLSFVANRNKEASFFEQSFFAFVIY